MKSGHYDYLTGYKATTASMTCQGFQFQLGVWYSIPEFTQLGLCIRGFHFCIHPSGPRSFYSNQTDRVFTCEAKDVLVEYTPGTLLKCVARHIRLISEIHPSDDRNTGHNNTGHYNTGDYNAGDYNAGDYNAGSYNTGYRNTGHYNTGDLNTSHYNTGYGNTGNCNTGDYNTGGNNAGSGNTGHYNTGDRNTGDRNTGSYNTGWGNAADNCTGFFCDKEPEVLCFNTPTGLTRFEFLTKYGTLAGELAQKIMSPKKFDYTAYKALPGWSLSRIKALHKAHMQLS